MRDMAICKLKMRILRRNRVNAGLCPGCGLSPPELDRKRCRECNKKLARQKANWSRSIRENVPGMCSRCDRRLPRPGRKTCDVCGNYYTFYENPNMLDNIIDICRESVKRLLTED